MDVLQVFITINGRKELIDNYCGSELPPQIMSNGPSMAIEFRSLHGPKQGRGLGFRAIYNFVTSKWVNKQTNDVELDLTRGSDGPRTGLQVHHTPL